MKKSFVVCAFLRGCPSGKKQMATPSEKGNSHFESIYS